MSPDDLLIRRAGLADVKAIWEIEKLSFPSPWSRWAIMAELSNPVSAMLVAGPPAPQPWQLWGYIIYWLVAQEMHILNLAVHPAHRRRGIARRLLTEALVQARVQGAEEAWLEVRPSNQAALDLYQSFGFEEVGVRPLYYADTHEDALLLVFSWAGKEGNSTTAG